MKKPLKIIHSTTPLRFNDIGGWTDTWFSGEGKVLNIAISPQVEVLVKVFENCEEKEERVLVHARDYGDTFLVNPEKPSYDIHPMIQGALNSLPIPKELKLEVDIFSHLPAGSSIGTSASVCVALLGGLDSFSHQKHSIDDIISLAHRVETEKLRMQSGIQDQICAGYGGICFIHMFRYPQADITKLSLTEKVEEELGRRLCFVYLGKGHSSSALHERVIAALEKGGPQFQTIQELRDLAEKAKDFLINGDLESYGDVMIQNNEFQRSLHPDLISKDADSVIEIAKKFRASGWKINGAGGEGGSLSILTCQEEGQRQQMLKEINSLGRGIESIPISLSHPGLRVTSK